MNEKDTTQFTYGVYARKSSESEDKQVQSIERQVDDFFELQKRENLDFFEPLIRESKSAFSVGREGFDNLVALTRKGQINAWLCWHANRLSRNPIDAGAIIDLMDKGLLHHIRTPSRIYFATPTDKMMLQIEFTMSKKDSDDKSVFVKSGLKKRYKKGFPCGKAPIGFLNDKTKERGDRDWLIDRSRFDKLKLVFYRFLIGKDSLNTITDYARDELKLTTPKSKRLGGKLVGRSLMEHILKNPIYAGFFYSKDEYGAERTFRKLNENIPRIITEDEHFKILNIFGDRCHTKKQSHLTPYSGHIKGADGNHMGADVKLQVICDCTKKFAYRSKKVCPNCFVKISEMQNPKYLSYTYYYNVKRKQAKGISSKSIEENIVDKALIDFFENELNVKKEFFSWTKIHLKELQQEELERDKKMALIQRKALKDLESKKERLRELFVEQMISKEEFQRDLKKLEKVVSSQKSQCEYVENWYEKVEDFLDMVSHFGSVIKKGSYSDKKQALEILCPNLVWDEEKLLIYKGSWLETFSEGRKTILKEYPMFEPENNVDFKGLNNLLDVRCPTLLGLLDKLRKKLCIR